MVFPDIIEYNNKIVEIGVNYANAGVSRKNTPEQVYHFLEFTHLKGDLVTPYCAAFGGFIRAHAYCDLNKIPYTSTNVVSIFQSVVHDIEQHDIKISASCEEVRQYAIHKGIFVSGDAARKLVLKPGWVALFNFEDETSVAHHYTTVMKRLSPDTFRTVEGNTSDNSEGNGGAVAVKERSFLSQHFRGIVRTY